LKYVQTTISLYKKNSDAGLLAKIQAAFVGFCYWLANLFFKAAAYFLWPKKIEVSPKKICVYRVGNIGDIICTIPALIAIRRTYPDAFITLLTSTGRKGIGAKELIDKAWFIDRLWVYYPAEIKSCRNLIEFITKLRTESFDLWINFPQDRISFNTLLRNLLFIKLCKVKKAVGFELSTFTFWPHAQSVVYFFENEVERLANLLKRWGVPVSGKIEYNLPIPEKIKESALRIIKENKINSPILFGLVPGAGYKANQWPLDNFVEVADSLLRKYPNSQIIIFGGPGDYEKGSFIKNKIKSSSVINLCGKLSLLENAFIINKLNLVISNNTGLMHMSSLAGIKVIAIFSATTLDGKWFPYGENSRVLIKRINCEGCYYRKCSCDYKCIKSITPPEVFEVINIYLVK